MGEVMDKIKGKAKQVEGKLTGNQARQNEGAMQEIQGNLKGVAEKTKRAARNIADTVTSRAKRHVP